MGRVVVALGGNALLKRGEDMTADNQRKNARIAAEALAPLCLEHETVITHGNGPQVGLLALQELAYEGEDSPLDVLGRRDRGHDRLHDRAGTRQHPAVREADRHDPDHGRGRSRTTRPSRTRPSSSARSTPRRRPKSEAAAKGWQVKPDGKYWRRVVPSPLPKRIFQLRPIKWLLEKGTVVIAAGGGGIPTMYEPGKERHSDRRRMRRSTRIARRPCWPRRSARTSSSSRPMPTLSISTGASLSQRAIRSATPDAWTPTAFPPARWGRRSRRRRTSPGRPASARSSAPCRTSSPRSKERKGRRSPSTPAKSCWCEAWRSPPMSAFGHGKAWRRVRTM